MPKNRKWTDDDLKLAVKNSLSTRTALKELGLKPAGGNYKNIKKHIERLGLDVSHHTGQGYLRGKTHSYSKPIPLKEVLVSTSYYSTSMLKTRLIKEGLLKNKCATCNINSWLKKELVLHLDHINGVNIDNRLNNLRLLCPNCHSQTDTYCGKNKGKQKLKPRPPQSKQSIKSKPKPKPRPKQLKGMMLLRSYNENVIIDLICATNIKSAAKSLGVSYQSVHKYINERNIKGRITTYTQKEKINWPDDDTLLKMIRLANFSIVSRKLGVSDNAIRKRLKRNGLTVG